MTFWVLVIFVQLFGTLCLAGTSICRERASAPRERGFVDIRTHLKDVFGSNVLELDRGIFELFLSRFEFALQFILNVFDSLTDALRMET